MSSKNTTPSPVKWLDDVADHDYHAAENYLTLKMTRTHAEKIVASLRDAKLTTRRPNDILRAAGLPALPMNDPGVHRDLLKLLNGEKLSPVLVIGEGRVCDVGDGYHRVSLCYWLDPFMEMPLKIG
jgi:hypothetical protein